MTTGRNILINLSSLTDGATMSTEPTKQYSVASVSGDTVLTKADATTVTLFEGVTTNLFYGRDFTIITAANPGKVQIETY